MSEMKNITLVISILAANALCTPSQAQEYLIPEWKFHFAFEDATGTRDTVWIYLDSQINSWYPYEQGAFGVFPFSIPSDEFSVYTGYSQSEYGKVSVGNIEWPKSFEIYASNYILPLTLSWDTALFNATVLQETVAGPICNPRMDNQWFFMQTNAPWLHHQYSMIFGTQVVLPEFWWGDPNQHFPISVYFDRAHNCNPLSTKSTSRGHPLSVYPNPCTDFVQLRSGAVLQEVEVYSLQGKKLLQQFASSFTGSSQEMLIDVTALPPGMYVLHAVAADGSRGSGKFVVSK